MSTGRSRYSNTRSNRAREDCTSVCTESSDETGKKSRVCRVVNATRVPIEIVGPPVEIRYPATPYISAGMIAKVAWIEPITQRPAIRERCSRSARRRLSSTKRADSSSVWPIVFASSTPDTDSDSSTSVEMSASVPCMVDVS